MMKQSNKQYIDLYRAHRDMVNDGSTEVMNQQREAAAALLEEQGLPSHKEERYKYTDAEEAFAPDYGLNLRRTPSNVDPYEVYKCNVPNLSTSLFFVVNDVPCDAPQSARALLPEGVIITSFRQAATMGRADLLEKYYNQAAANDRDFKTGHDGVTLLNTLLAQDGLLIYLPKGTELKAPIQVVNVAAARMDMMCVRRIIVVAKEGAKGSVLFCDHAEGDSHYLTTQVIEAYAEEGAKLNLYSIEETNDNTTRFSTLYVEQAAQSRISYDGIVLTCGKSRNRLDVRLRGEEATTELYGAVIADDKQRVDNNILVEHLSPKCTSDMLYKYVLDGQSNGAFAGKVYVAPGAQQTASEQTNANICVTPTARAFSQPMLEIYADDVKCNHGSTIGKLDEGALFYMRQRGISEAEARLMLQHAFINDVLRHVDIEHLHDRLSHLVDLRFRKELGQGCHGCKGCAKK